MGIDLILSSLIITYFSLVSIPINFLLSLTAATPVDPDPIQLSNTVSPSLENVLINHSNNGTGFCVGCTCCCAEKSLDIFRIDLG